MNPPAFQSFFTTQQLHNYVTKLYKNQIKPQKQVQPQIVNINFLSHIVEEHFDCLAGLELQKEIVYAFGKNNEMNCQIVFYSFRKKDGVKQSFTLKQITGTITCLTFMLFATKKQTENKNDSPKATYKLIAGFKEGFIKIINLAGRVKLETLKMDVKPVVSILQGNYDKFHNQNVCIVLSQDYYVYFVDVEKVEIVFILRPNLIMCDKALSIEINQQYSYLMQTTQGGYIIFWKMANILNHFRERSKQNKAKSDSREFNVFPARINHSIAVQGIIWSCFYGHIIAIITKSGVLKLVAINVRTEGQFILLLQYQIQHPESITYARMYPEHGSIFIAKTRGTNCFIQKLLINDYLTINKMVVINITNMDVVNEFFLPNNSQILMCRGHKCYGIGICQDLFEKQQRQIEMQPEKDY